MVAHLLRKGVTVPAGHANRLLPERNQPPPRTLLGVFQYLPFCGTNNSTVDSGAIYIFTRNGCSESQQAYVKASNTDTGDGFGSAIALAADDNNLAVGAFGETSKAAGLNGDQVKHSAAFSEGRHGQRIMLDNGGATVHIANG